jgi:hypothetical protein
MDSEYHFVKYIEVSNGFRLAIEELLSAAGPLPMHSYGPRG